MRNCIICERPMHTSLESIWIKNENYNIHVKCKDKIEKNKLKYAVSQKDEVKK